MTQISSVIDLETQLLISVGAAVAAGCVPCLQNIVEQGRIHGIDEKKMRAAARTGQFMKEQPIKHMKVFSDELLGTHLLGVPAETACCPAGADESEKSKTIASVSTPACSCS
ncbi:MAG: carboxymuconolactone decarboxylase family protein [Syntrophaceae bacterium]